jgi:hypothetical protein
MQEVAATVRRQKCLHCHNKYSLYGVLRGWVVSAGRRVVGVLFEQSLALCVGVVNERSTTAPDVRVKVSCLCTTVGFLQSGQ